MTIMPHGDISQQRGQWHEQDAVIAFMTKRWIDRIRPLFQKVPNRMRPLPQTSKQFTFAFGVAEKITKPTRIDVFAHEEQVFGVEFKTFWILMNDLIDAIQKLYKYR